MDDHIGLFALGDGLGLVNGGALLTVFGSNTFIALPPYRPTVFIRHYMLVPGTGAGLLPRRLENGFDKFQDGFEPGGFRGHFNSLEAR